MNTTLWWYHTYTYTKWSLNFHMRNLFVTTGENDKARFIELPISFVNMWGPFKVHTNDVHKLNNHLFDISFKVAFKIGWENLEKSSTEIKALASKTHRVRRYWNASIVSRYNSTQSTRDCLCPNNDIVPTPFAHGYSNACEMR